MNIFKQIYSKVLDKKRKYSKLSSFRVIDIPNTSLNTTDELNFAKGKLLPLSNQTSFYVNVNILDDYLMCHSRNIQYRAIYSLSEFHSKTKITILIFSNNELVDPNKIYIQIINRNTFTIRIDEVITNVSIMIFDGVQIFGRYNTNISIPIEDELINSYIVFTNGKIDWIPYIGSSGSYTIPINAQGKVMVLVAFNKMYTYKSIPIDNGQFISLQYPLNKGFIELTNTFVFKEDISGYTIPTEYTPLYDGFKVDTIDERIVVYFTRSNIDEYEDLRHYYNTHKEYMTEYLAGNLPAQIATYTPYEPIITDDTTFAQFIEEMKLASKDYINIYKKYLEDLDSFQLTNWNIISINCEFKRNSTAIDDNKNIVEINEPRFNNDNIFKQGIYIEESIDNFNKDPYFLRGINNELIHSLKWSIPYQNDIDINYSIKDGVLHHYSIVKGTDNKSINLTSPTITFDKTKPHVIQFKIRYLQKVGNYNLYILGGIVDNIANSILDLETYLTKTEIDSEGFEYREYRIPANVFSGSMNTGNIGLQSEIGQNAYLDYFIKEFQIIDKEYSMGFCVSNREKEILKIPSTSMLNTVEGSIEIIFTPKTLFNGGRIYQTNISSDTTASRSLIFINSDGSITFEPRGFIRSTINTISSGPNTLQVNKPSYIAMTWKDTVIYVYHNGVLLGTTTTGAFTLGTALYIGCSAEENNQANAIFHDIRFSSKLRTSSEILSVYNSDKTTDVDEYTTYKLNFDEKLQTPNELLHLTKLSLKSDPKELLFFNNGLNIIPAKIERNSGIYSASFRENDITDDNIISIDIGKDITPYIEGKSIEYTETDQGISDYLTGSDIDKYDTTLFGQINISNKYHLIYNGFEMDSVEFYIGPSSKISPESDILIYQTTEGPDNIRKFVEINKAGYVYTVDENMLKVNISLAHTDKDIYVCTQKYNRCMSKPYSNEGMIILPTWASFISKNNIHVFLKGRLLPRENSYLFNPLEYRVVKGDTVLALDLDTDVLNGENITALISSQFELVEYNTTLIDESKIIQLTDKSYPFSKKYNLVFIDGKFINPSDIIEVDTFRFSVNSNSIKNMCIFRKKFDIQNSDTFENLLDKWAEYLAVLSIEDIENIIGTLNQVFDNENNIREIYYNERHLFEILYNYCLKDRRELTEEDNIAIKEELSDILLADGRIPISTIRDRYPRYQL